MNRMCVFLFRLWSRKRKTGVLMKRRERKRSQKRKRLRERNSMMRNLRM